MAMLRAVRCASVWAFVGGLGLVSVVSVQGAAAQARPITSLPKSPDDPGMNVTPPSVVTMPQPAATPAATPAAASDPTYGTSANPVQATPVAAPDSSSATPVTNAPVTSAPVMSTPMVASTSMQNAAGGPKEKPGVKKVHAFSTAAIGVNVGVAGVGVMLATPLAQAFNVRFGGSFFSYSDTFTQDGLQISGDLKFRSATMNIDWFPFHGGFHISPGVTLYNGNNLNAAVLVPGGQTFSLGDQNYYSSVTDPVHGTASVTFGNRTAPNVTVGWGNMIPRSGKHFTVPFEVGIQYIGAPLINLTLAGSGCSTGVNSGCAPLATDPTSQANLRQEQNDLNDSIKPLRFYPILSLGFAYKF